ncbi:hypothetical protein ACLBWT_02665 [Paenibacillus sp. D51F]
MFTCIHCTNLDRQGQARTRPLEYEQYFYFAPGAASLSEESGICLANEPGGANLAVIPVEDGVMRFRLQEGKVSKVGRACGRRTGGGLPDYDGGLGREPCRPDRQ